MHIEDLEERKVQLEEVNELLLRYLAIAKEGLYGGQCSSEMAYVCFVKLRQGPGRAGQKLASSLS